MGDSRGREGLIRVPKRQLASCWLSLFLCLPLLSHAQASNRAEELKLIFQRITEENEANSIAFNGLKTATQTIGHRLSGSENGHKAEDFMLFKAKEIGLKPNRFQAFTLPVWNRLYVDLEVVPHNSDHYVHYPAVALAHSPLDSEVEADLVDAGNGLPEDFERLGKAAEGKIVVCNIGIAEPKNGRKNLHRSEKAALAIQAKAAGVIFVNSAPGQILLTGTASVDGGLIPIPALCISAESGKALREWLTEEVLISKIRMENSLSEGRARNVISTIKGTKKPNEVIVVGAHLDSWDLASGAVDNGLGSFTILEMARLFKALNLQPERTIQFVWFMGEEQGLFGSKHFVNQLQKTRNMGGVKYMLNFDMAGNAFGWETFGLGKSGEYFKGVGAIEALMDTAFENQIEPKAELHSDHEPFLLAGIPVAQPLGDMPLTVYHCYHSDCDNFKLIQPEYMDRTARIATLLLYALATEPELPAPRMNREQTRSYLIRNGLKEKLEIRRAWKF